MLLRVLFARTCIVCAALLGSASLMPGQVEETFVVIVHPSNPVSNLGAQRISALFLKQTRQWESGIEAMPVDLSERSPIRIQFSKVVLKRSARAVRAFWNQRVFLGRDTAPRELASEGQVVDFVAANRGAIGYVSWSARLDRVKTISTVAGQSQ